MKQAEGAASALQMPIDYHKYKELGKCVKCGSPTFNKTALCYPHWLYRIYTGMKGRCGNKYGNPKSEAYANVKLEVTLDEFMTWGITNPPAGLSLPSIDRIRNEKGYHLANMRWVNQKNNRGSGQHGLPLSKYRCPKCKTVYERTTDSFHRNKAQGDGLANWCKRCSNTLRLYNYYKRKTNGNT